MGATPKALRQPPQRRFENYVLTRSTGRQINLVNVSDRLFLPAGAAGGSYDDDSVSSPIEIGFDFSIDGITYKKFVVCSNGWIALVDPTTGTFSISEILDDGSWVNSAIKTTFTSNAVLIAPWFDDLRGVANDAQHAVATYGQTKVDRIKRGLETPPPPIDEVKFGAKYYNDDRSPGGRRLIVRWNSLSDFSTPNAVVRFEAILYENGKIEFRYAPRQSINLVFSAATPEDATIGIFMPNGTDRWRDFSYGLGYRDAERQMYRYGGIVVTSSYNDTDVDAGYTRNYTSNLEPFIHWPGTREDGGMYTFSPPSNRRKILPRIRLNERDSSLTLPTIVRTGDKRRGNDPISFDDRRTQIYYASSSSLGVATASILVNAPSMLQRFYGDTEPNVVARQNLFAGDLEFTASVVKATDDFIVADYQSFIEPFSEHKLFENDATSTEDEFFTSGSRIDNLGTGLSQPLKAKTQIRFSLPINHTCVSLGNTSSIHYYNVRKGAWNIPQNSSYTLPNGATTNTSGRSTGDLVIDLSTDSANQRILEHHRGFGPIGNLVISGSHTPTTTGDQTDSFIGSSFNSQNFTNAISKEYSKSLTISNDYRASVDELFKLPINQPFLVEKAVIELPFAAGDGWFNDMTTCMMPLDNTPGSFDFGGPALTISILNQTNAGERSRRDVVLSGTLTHYNDSTSNNIIFSAFSPISSTYQIRPSGFKAFNAIAGGVVSPISTSSGYTFTGSVAVKCEAQITNGVVVRLEMAMTGGSVQTNRQGVLDVFNTPEIILENKILSNYSQSAYIAYINNFGRGGTGFDPSGRSIFGKEFTTFQETNSRGKIKNPFFISATLGGATTSSYLGIPTQFSGAITNGSTFRFEAAIPLEGNKPSPYIIMPGDTLVLAVSKTRPVFFGSQTSYPKTSGSIIHDVTLMTGSVNVVLYGSLLREDKEYHDTLNQSLASDALHEIIGSDPVLDQFDTDYREIYTGSTYDDFVAGNLITKISRPDGRIAFVTGTVLGSKTSTNILSVGTRGRIFSKNSARSSTSPGTSDFDFTDSYSYRLQPYFEKAGTLRLAQAVDNTERFWDSMMPAINQCFKANGANICVMKPSLAGGSYMGDPDKVDQRTGFIWFDFQAPLLSAIHPLIDGIWTWSFPYESRYSQVPRQQFVERSFIADYEFDPSISPLSASSISAIRPRTLTSFFFGPVGCELPSVPAMQHTRIANHEVTQSNGTYAGFDSMWACDIPLGTRTRAGFQLTSSVGAIDATKALFGFGDVNNRVHTSFDSESAVDANGAITGKSYFGTTHWADFRVRKFDEVEYAWGNWWCISPIIRGWKYGVYSGLPAYSKAYFRQNRYGQFRDMLEQRLCTKYYQTAENGPVGENFQAGQTTAVVTVRFVDASGKLTKPENTWSQNLSFEATSSVPYFDGETRNRQPINVDTLNSNIVTLKANRFGQVTL